ncbi:MAG: hypothetical protein ACREJN_11085 [Nitrospiraceae bacterium]
MHTVKWTGAFLVLGLLVAMHSFAGSNDVPEGITDMADYYEEPRCPTERRGWKPAL